MARKKAPQKMTTRQRQSQMIAREKAKKKFMRTTWRRCIILVTVLAAAYMAFAGWWYVDSGKLSEKIAHVEKEFYSLTADAGFAVRDVFLDGRESTPLEEVTQATGLKHGDPILSVSVDEIRERLEALPRVRYVEIERVLPDTLHIHLQEREPVALWQDNGHYSLVDIEGKVMDKCEKACPSLPVVVGEDAPSKTPQLLSFLAKEPELYKQMESAVRVGERRWNIRFKNKVEVKLPEQNPEAAWQQLAKMQREQQVLSRAVSVIDLRLSDRIFIKLSPEAEKPLPTGASQT